MSRMQTGDVIYTKPTNNIYTVLAIVGVVAVLTGFILFYIRSEAILGKSLFQ
jgi:hypothetical protein